MGNFVRYLFSVSCRDFRRAGPSTSPVERVRERRCGKAILFKVAASRARADTRRPVKIESVSIARGSEDEGGRPVLN